MGKQRGQDLVVSSTYIWMKLRDFFWGAWKIYGWEKNDPGIGIAEETVKQALTEHLHIRVSTSYGTYEITPTKLEKLAKEYNSYHTASDKKILLVTPRSAWDKVGEVKITPRLEGQAALFKENW